MTERIDTDVVIVGAGLGGLSAARYLQEAGYEVVVLEGHSKPGGYAHFFRYDDFRFEVALHALDGLGEEGWARPMFETLGILDRVEFNELDPFYTVQFPDFEVAVPTDIPEYLAAVEAALPGETGGVADLFEAIKRVGDDFVRYATDRSAGVRAEPSEMMEKYPDMAIAFASPWEAFVNNHVETIEARALVSTLWGYLGLPPSRVSAGMFALTLLSYHTGGAWYPTGGSGAMSWAISEVIEENGGAVRFRDRITAIDPTADSGFVVTTHKGLEVHARAVVSNASPTVTADLLPDGAFDDGWLASVRSETPALSTFIVHLGLDKDVAAEGWDYHEFFAMVGYDYESEYDAILGGEFRDAGMIISNYTVMDPTCAPEDGSVIVLTSLAPWDYENVWGTGGDLDGYRSNPEYVKLKEEAAEILIEKAEQLIPGLRESIVVQRVGTPITHFRYVRQPGGSIYGREQTVMSQMNRRKSTTPIPNLFLAGAWIGGGGMTAAIGSGKAAAKATVRYLETDSSG